MKSPLLIPIPDTFDEYLASLSKHGRYEYRRARIAAVGYDHAEVPPQVNVIAQWMDFWTTQTVAGKHPKWRQWTAQKAIDLGVRMFVAGPGRTTALQLLEVYGSYAYAWPVLYDKAERPWLAKFMWFRLIEWCCEDPEIAYLDLGGNGSGRTWRQVVADYRAGKDRGNYKWLYVPRELKHTRPLDTIPAFGVHVGTDGRRTLR